MASLLSDTDTLIDSIDRILIQDFAKKHLHHNDIINNSYYNQFFPTYIITWFSERFDPSNIYDIYGYGDKYMDAEEYEITKKCSRLYLDENNIIPFTKDPIMLINYKEEKLPHYIKIKSKNPINIIALNCNENLQIEGANIFFYKTYCHVKF